MEDFRFPPDAERARRLDRAMQTGLADSLEHICEECRGELSYDAPRMERIVTDLRAARRYPPSTFAIYYELVTALMEERHEAAEGLFRELAGETSITNGLKVLPLGAPEIAACTPRFQRMMNSDPTTHFDFLPPPADVAAAFREQFARGLALIERVMPELAGEVRALVSQVLMAVGNPDANNEFDGGSAYTLWGALFLNATSHESDVAMAEVIAHESAHCLLFGFSTEETLVLNPDDELHPSPLRRDPRPMDGIYHATFVSARMHWAMSRLIESGVLDRKGMDAAMKARDEDLRNFHDGYATVAAHGQLTHTGEQLMSAAKSYMDTA